MDDQLVAYALDLLDPDDRAAVESHLAAHPEDGAKLARLRRALLPLEADRDGYDPPAGLAAATLARTAEYAVAHRLIALQEEPAGIPTPATLRAAGIEPVFAGAGWRRFDLAVAACVGFLAMGLLVSGIAKVRLESEVRGCQNNLRQLYVALAGYSETHGGYFPKVGTDEVPVAGAFADELARAGQLPAGGLPPCPAGPAPQPDRFAPKAVAPTIAYAYTLGYRRADGDIVGVRRAEGERGTGDWVPVSADLPDASRPHSRGLNVLYAGGTVRLSSTPAAGVNGDDIYLNDEGRARAGRRPDDAVLGRPPDFP